MAHPLTSGDIPNGTDASDLSPPARRADALLAWLSSKFDALQALGRDHATSATEFWEPFLAEIARCKDAEACLLLAGSPPLLALRKSLSVWFSDYACWRDLDRAEALCAAYLGAGVPDRLSLDMRRFLLQERLMVEEDLVTGPTSALFVGCGASPETLLHYASLGRGFGRVVGLDNRPPAVARASETFRRLGLDRVEARLGEALVFDYGPFDFIHLANFVTPKPTILAQVARTAGRGTRIVVREPTFLEQVLCDPIDPADSRGLEVRSRRASEYCSMTSVLMVVT